MTVPVQSLSVAYAAPVKDDTYSVPFRYWGDEHLRVRFRLDTDPVTWSNPLAVDTDYSLDPSGLSYSGGELTLKAAVPADATHLDIEAATIPAQETALPAVAVHYERALDRLAMVAQEQGGRIDGTLVISGIGTIQTADSRAAVEGLSIGASVKVLLTAGYAAPGDGGAAMYNRVDAEPGHALKVQSGDGAWWELVPDLPGVSVRQAGAKGDDVTDDSQAFLDALDFGNHNPNQDNSRAATDRVIVPPGAYYIAGTSLQLKKAVHILGSGSGRGANRRPAVLRWDANVTGFIVHDKETIDATTESPGTGSGEGSIIQGLKLISDGGTIAGVTDGAKGHGIWLRQRAALRDLLIEDFPGNGINVEATSNTGDTAKKGNSNLWTIDGARITGCHLNGVYVDGADVNAGRGSDVDAVSNGRWGIHDSSFLGNTWIACHTSDNGLAGKGENGAGESSWVEFDDRLYAANVAATEAQLVATEPGTDPDVWIDTGAGSSSSTVPTWQPGQPEGTYFHGGDLRTDNANARNLFLGCYTEGNSAPPQLIRPTMAIGAHRGKGWRGNFYGFDLTTSEAVFEGPNWRFHNHQVTSPARELTLDLNHSVNSLARLKAEGDHAIGVSLASWLEGDNVWQIGQHGASGRGALHVTTDLSTQTYGRSAAPGGGYPTFERGMWLGFDTNGRYRTVDDGPPASGEHARGDFYENRDPSEQTDSNGDNWVLLGWSCVAAGTPGTWVPCWARTDPPGL